MKNRYCELDVIRVLACLMVILMHSPRPTENAIGLFCSTLSYLTMPCIGLFFMVSGALLLPIKIDTATFLKKRFSKIVFPTLFWSLFYILLNLITQEKGTPLVKSFLSIPFSPQHKVLWFMYTLSGLYLIAPIISSWITKISKRELELYLILWMITMLYPVLELFLDVRQDTTGMLYYVSGYAGYFLLGYYMKSYPQTMPFKIIVPLSILSLLVPVCCKIGKIEIDFYRMFGYLSIFVVIQCVMWFRLITKFLGGGCKSSPLLPLLEKCSNLSFGIYLIHIFILAYVLGKWRFIMDIDSYILQTFVIAILTFISSLMICWLISHLPKADYIIGYKSKK